MHRTKQNKQMVFSLTSDLSRTPVHLVVLGVDLIYFSFDGLIGFFTIIIIFFYYFAFLRTNGNHIICSYVFVFSCFNRIVGFLFEILF